MRRWLVIVLLALVPLQLSWAAVSAYCGHEGDAAAQHHLGHHEHRAAADHAGDSLVHDEPQADASAAGFDQDCGTCHLGMAVLPSPAAPLALAAGTQWPVSTPGRHFGSADPQRLERPDWVA